MHELGVLGQVRSISSVSGGSILAAFLADAMVAADKAGGADDFARWLQTLDWQRDIETPFCQFVSHDLRTGLILRHLAWNWLRPEFRVRDLERTYQRRLTKLTLGQLPKYPKFILCATNLTFGVNWIFTRKLAGDYRAGYLASASEWPLARAVAASSSFPPVFGPMPIRAPAEDYQRGSYREPGYEKLLARTALTDGGVYDNVGLEPVWKSHADLLVSDCGAPFAFSLQNTPLRRLLRYTAVIAQQAFSLRLRLLFSGDRDEKYRAVYWNINTAAADDAPPTRFAGYSSELVKEVVSGVRTDLDAFTKAEMRVLINHGYYAADRRIGKYGDGLIATPGPTQTPYPQWEDAAEVRRALRTSHRRVSLARCVTVFMERRGIATE